MKDIINYNILKNKYNTGLDFRKNIFARLLCKHEFGKYTLPKDINMLCVSEHTQVVVCTKCGKVKGFEKIFY